MRTNIELDDELMKEAENLTGIRVKRHLIHEALRVLVALKKRRPISELIDKVQLDEDYDYKSLRR